MNIGKFRVILLNIKLKHYAPRYFWDVRRSGSGFIMRFRSQVYDNYGHVEDWQAGRWYYLSEDVTEGAIVRTALMSLLAFEEHELREKFTYKGQALYEPDHS